MKPAVFADLEGRSLLNSEFICAAAPHIITSSLPMTSDRGSMIRALLTSAHIGSCAIVRRMRAAAARAVNIMWSGGAVSKGRLQQKSPVTEEMLRSCN